MTNVEQAARALEGLPYLWGGSTPADRGLDCSGLVQWCWNRAGLLPTYQAVRLSSAGLWAALTPTNTPVPGDAAFYSSTPDGRISHVVLILDGGQIIGANGGDRPLLEEWDETRGWISEAAKQTYVLRMKTRNACVNIKSSAAFRRHLRGYREAPR